ncbi:hypothetical protein ACERK3_12770 [Phycisphaerales bacterium AB-hyl4]|uniref:Uncharacterized protein n=1 Tax=Natronomicrosphaera hydrolytica TaxID=3242702 RepID=A0ABV4U8L6_9BACT
MTWYTVQGVDPETGESAALSVEALTPANATAKATKLGMIVTAIERVAVQDNDVPRARVASADRAKSLAA